MRHTFDGCCANAAKAATHSPPPLPAKKVRRVITPPIYSFSAVFTFGITCSAISSIERLASVGSTQSWHG